MFLSGVAVAIAELEAHLLGGRVDVCGGNVVLFGERRGQQQAVAERVDPPRNSRGEGVNRVEGPGLEPGIFAPTHVPQPMLDVGLSLGAVHRSQVIGRGYPLAQLLELGALHQQAQLGLAHQKALQEPLVAELEVGQHAQFFDRAAREILGFVDDQQGALALRHERHEERFELGEQLRLVDRLRRQSERHGDGMQQLLRVELGRDQLGGNESVGIDLFEQAAHKRGLTGTDFSGDDDEAFTLVHAVLQVGEGALVAATAVEKGGIGIELKGLAGQPEKRLVHVTA